MKYGLSAKQYATLAALVEKTNGTRKVRLLEPERVFDAIENALQEDDGVGIVHGGEANDGTQRTTLCLAFRDGAKMTVGVGLSKAQDAGPGRTWKKLQPWSTIVFEKNLERLRAWAKQAAPDRLTFTIKGAKQPRIDENALLAAVLADPDDDDARAVYADKLIEAGDPRGTFISLQLALAKTKEHSRRYWELLAEVVPLENEHGELWSREIAQHTLGQYFWRGFIRAIDVRARTFATHGEKLVKLAPIERIELHDLDASSLKRIVKTRALAAVRRLDLLGADIDADGLAQLLGAAPKLSHVAIPTNNQLMNVAMQIPGLLVMIDGTSQNKTAKALRGQNRLLPWLPIHQ